MKLTYENCDQLQLVNGNLVHRFTGKIWEEADAPCACCGDDFIRRTDNGKLSAYCERNCYQIGPSNALKVRAITGKIPKIRTSDQASTANTATKKVSNAMKRVYERKKDSVLEEMSSEHIAALRKLQQDEFYKSVEIETAQEVIGPRKRSPMSAETKMKIGNANRGRTRSLETRMKMRNRRMGRKYTILVDDPQLPQQIENLKHSGQDVGVIATVAIKSQHEKLVNKGLGLMQRFMNLFRGK